VDWDLAHPECLLQVLSSSMSDHCPIMMSTNVSFHRKSRFHFQAHWPRIAGFAEAVASGWYAEEQHPDPFIDLQQRLKSTARVLTRWSQRRIGNVKEQILLANEVIRQLDMAMDQRNLNEDEFWLRAQLKKKVLGLASLERTIARQRSRIRWLQEGDANTSFFHVHASIRRRRNHIFSLRSGGTPVTEQAAMEEMATEHYTQLLGEPVRTSKPWDKAGWTLLISSCHSRRAKSQQPFAVSRRTKRPDLTGSPRVSSRLAGR
jgi:hypothetical protein